MTDTSTRLNNLEKVITDLVMRHSPSGMEREVDDYITARFTALGYAPVQDSCGNIIVHIKGREPGAITITAHKDEIGAIVTDATDPSRVKVRKLSGSFPWIYGEGVVDVLGDERTVPGILSFGSRHISHISPQFEHQREKALKWEDVWIETKTSAENLKAAGVHAGSRVVIGKHRKAPLRMGDSIASYTLDNKASVAILLALAERGLKPRCDLYLVATSKEEIGAIGAMFFTDRVRLDAMIALEIAPLSSEYAMADDERPVLLAEDAISIYDDAFNLLIKRAADRAGVDIQLCSLSGFGSDASMAFKAGKVAAAACLGFPTQNTHGFEIANLAAIANCVDVLASIVEGDVVNVG